MNGEGVPLGWMTLLRRHMDEGRLVRIGTDCLTRPERHHLLVPSGRQPSAAAGRFIDGVLEVFG